MPSARGKAKGAGRKARSKTAASPKKRSRAKSAGSTTAEGNRKESLPAAIDVAGMDDEASEHRRPRRDVRLKVERLVTQKLSHVQDHILRAARNSRGQSIRESIGDAVRACTTKGEYLPIKYWSDLYRDFGLAQSCAEDLPEPVVDSNVTKPFLDAFAYAHHDNPAFRKIGPIVSHLTHATKLSAGEWYALFGGSQYGPTMTRAMSLKLQYHVLITLARLEMNTTLPEYWTIMRDSLGFFFPLT
jgi:hypothetical protein